MHQWEGLHEYYSMETRKFDFFFFYFLTSQLATYSASRLLIACPKTDRHSYISSQEQAYLSAVMFCNNFLSYAVHIDRSVFLYNQ